MVFPLVNQVREIFVVQSGRNNAIKGGGCLQATATLPRCIRPWGGREGDGTAHTTAVIDGHLALTLETQRHLPVAAQATQGAVVGEEPVEQAGTYVLNQGPGTRLTA